MPGLIVHCAEQVLASGACDEEALRALLRNIVLVGGAADIPGMRPRTEYEVRRLLANSAGQALRSALASPNDAFVLNPPLSDQSREPLTSPRFAPFFGGCVRAVASCPVAGGVAQGSLPSSAARGSPHSLGRAAGTLGAVPGIAAWVQRQLFSLNAPAIFRAGGGGGEEDDVWANIGGWQQAGGLAHEADIVERRAASAGTPQPLVGANGALVGPPPAAPAAPGEREGAESLLFFLLRIIMERWQAWRGWTRGANHNPVLQPHAGSAQVGWQ